MSESEENGFLHEELQRRLREEEYRRMFESRNFYRRLRRRRAALALALVTCGIAGYLLFFRNFELFQFPVMLVLGAAVSGSVLMYLQPSSIPREMGSPQESIFRMRYYIDEKISDAISELKARGQKGIEFSDADKASVLSNIQAKLESEALQSYVAGIKELMLGKVRDESFDERFQLTRRRLGQEVQDLAKRGNLNLVLGILTTLSGLSILAYAVFNPPTSQSAPELLAYFVPRVSLVVLIEVFAYFFLRLYKQSLGEIKYFQNEITNVEAKHLALQVALRSDDLALRSKIVEELSKTERNFILAKDQTTVDLERERMARNTYSGITDAIKEVLKKKSDG